MTSVDRNLLPKFRDSRSRSGRLGPSRIQSPTVWDGRPASGSWVRKGRAPARARDPSIGCPQSFDLQNAPSGARSPTEHARTAVGPVRDRRLSGPGAAPPAATWGMRPASVEDRSWEMVAGSGRLPPPAPLRVRPEAVGFSSSKRQLGCRKSVFCPKTAAGLLDRR